MADQDKEEMKKKVDETWKEEVYKEKDAEGPPQETVPEASFGLFVSGLMIEGLVALGEVEHPVTKKKEMNRVHAKFIVDTLAMLKDKTRNNLTKDEENALDAILYELRMRFVGKTKKA